MQFGNIVIGDQTSARAHLEALQERLAKTKKLRASYLNKMEEMNKFTKVVIDAYLNHVNVIVDLGSLLTLYNGVFAQIITLLNDLDADLLRDIDPNAFDHIRRLTDSSLQRVNDFFNQDVAAISEIMRAMGKPNMAENLNMAKGKYIATQQQVPQTLANFKIPIAGGKPRAPSK